MRIRKREIASLPKRDLVQLVWDLKKEAEECAETYGFGYSNEDRLGLCVMSPGQVLEAIESAIIGAKEKTA